MKNNHLELIRSDASLEIAPDRFFPLLASFPFVAEVELLYELG